MKREKCVREMVCRALVWCVVRVCAVHGSHRSSLRRRWTERKTKSREKKSQECSDAAGRCAEHLVDGGPDEHVVDGGRGSRSADRPRRQSTALNLCERCRAAQARQAAQRLVRHGARPEEYCFEFNVEPAGSIKLKYLNLGRCNSKK